MMQTNLPNTEETSFPRSLLSENNQLVPYRSWPEKPEPNRKAKPTLQSNQMLSSARE
jgi:hypothetical protein